MTTNQFTSIGFLLQELLFTDSKNCKVKGKIFIENGYYLGEIDMNVFQLHVILKHHGHIGRLIEMLMQNDQTLKQEQYPLHINVEHHLGHGLTFHADEFLIEKKGSRRDMDRKIQYSLKLISIKKLNKLRMIKNLRNIVKMNLLPATNLLSEDKMKEAYSDYQYFTSKAVKEEVAKQRTGLSNPYVFKMAQLYHSAHS